jgi:hypothetical protein
MSMRMCYGGSNCHHVVITGAAWETVELGEAAELLQNLVWNWLRRRCCCRTGRYENMGEVTLLAKARILQIALQMAQRDGHFNMR